MMALIFHIWGSSFFPCLDKTITQFIKGKPSVESGFPS